MNVLLAILAVAPGVEFWSDRGDGLPSRHGMVAAYAVIAVSFAAWVVQGMTFGEGMPGRLRDDVMLTIRLFVALLHIAASGAFALSLAYERDAFG